MVGRVFAGVIADGPRERKRQFLHKPIFNGPQINLYYSKPGQKMGIIKNNLTQLIPDELQTEWDKRYLSPNREYFNVDDGTIYKVRYTKDDLKNPVYELQQYFPMLNTNIKPERKTKYFPAEGNNLEIYKSWLKNKYTNEDDMIKEGTLKMFWPKDSPYNMPPNQK